MTVYAPLIMIGAFLAFGLLFSYGSAIADWIAGRKGQ